MVRLLFGNLGWTCRLLDPLRFAFYKPHPSNPGLPWKLPCCRDDQTSWTESSIHLRQLSGSSEAASSLSSKRYTLGSGKKKPHRKTLFNLRQDLSLKRSDNCFQMTISPCQLPLALWVAAVKTTACLSNGEHHQKNTEAQGSQGHMQGREQCVPNSHCHCHHGIWLSTTIRTVIWTVIHARHWARAVSPPSA